MSIAGAGANVALAFSGALAGGPVSFTGKSDWVPVLEIDLAVDALRALAIDAGGALLEVSVGNSGWTGASAARNV